MLNDKKRNVRASFAERPQKRAKPHRTPHCWTIDEVDKLKEFYEQFGNDPTKISEAFATMDPPKKFLDYERVKNKLHDEAILLWIHSKGKFTISGFEVILRRRDASAEAESSNDFTQKSNSSL